MRLRRPGTGASSSEDRRRRPGPAGSGPSSLTSASYGCDSHVPASVETKHRTVDVGQDERQGIAGSLRRRR